MYFLTTYQQLYLVAHSSISQELEGEREREKGKGVKHDV